MKFGLHVSIAGGLDQAPVNAAKSGAETFQMFTRSPRGGAALAITPEIRTRFKDNCRQFGFDDFYVHTPYYINLASANKKTASDSARVIKEDLMRAESLGAKALMTHLGSAKDLPRELALKQVAGKLEEILAGYTGSTQFLIELSAGSGNIIGDTFEEIALIIKRLQATSYKLQANIGVCFDTAHAFASGYDLRTAEAVKKTFRQFDKMIGLDRLALIHANDSKTGLGSHIDRHWHIGQGQIGLEGFKTIVNLPALKHIDLILETPRAEDKNYEKINLETLKKLRRARD